MNQNNEEKEAVDTNVSGVVSGTQGLPAPAKKEFEGELESISPKLLLNPEKPDKFQSFMIVLGVVFNDLKGLFTFRKILNDQYRKPDIREISPHMGEYSGLMLQTDKLLVATICEFLIFLDKHDELTRSLKFQVLIKKLPPPLRNSWDKLCNPSKDATTTIAKIARIRSNIAFHYDHSLEEIQKGYIRSFYTDRKDLVQHKRAHYSLGHSMAHTRFYFSDAAVEDYVGSHLEKDDRAHLQSVADDMNTTIQAILSAYIKGQKGSRKKDN